MGLETVLGLRRRGFFIPYRYAGSLPAPGGIAPYSAIFERMKSREAVFEDVLKSIDGYAAALLEIGNQAPPAPRWTQDWFPRLDAAAAYALVRRGRPKNIVEVGSGHSTRFLARAVADEGCVTNITAIDPAPRATIEGLGATTERRTLSAASSGVFGVLQAGDILFVDSSHILMPGSDVDDIINRVLPELPVGVLVHIHDIFLPQDYPPDWAWRGYNEQSAVAQLVLASGYEIVFASHYVAGNMGDKLGKTVLARLPFPAGAYETSLWLRKAA
jgi:hypothetical protein